MPDFAAMSSNYDVSSIRRNGTDSIPILNLLLIYSLYIMLIARETVRRRHYDMYLYFTNLGAHHHHEHGHEAEEDAVRRMLNSTAGNGGLMDNGSPFNTAIKVKNEGKTRGQRYAP